MLASEYTVIGIYKIWYILYEGVESYRSRGAQVSQYINTAIDPHTFNILSSTVCIMLGAL